MSDEFDFEKAEQDVSGEGPTLIRVEPDMLKRRVTWDMVPCYMAEAVIAKVGLQPASDEVEETEHHSSHARLNEIIPYAPILLNIAQYASEAACSAIMVSAEEDGQNTDDIVSPDVLSAIVFNSMVTVLAELNDVGLIHTLPISGKVFRMDDDEDQ